VASSGVALRTCQNAGRHRPGVPRPATRRVRVGLTSTSLPCKAVAGEPDRVYAVSVNLGSTSSATMTPDTPFDPTLYLIAGPHRTRQRALVCKRRTPHPGPEAIDFVTTWARARTSSRGHLLLPEHVLTGLAGRRHAPRAHVAIPRTAITSVADDRRPSATSTFLGLATFQTVQGYPQQGPNHIYTMPASLLKSAHRDVDAPSAYDVPSISSRSRVAVHLTVDRLLRRRRRRWGYQSLRLHHPRTRTRPSSWESTASVPRDGGGLARSRSSSSIRLSPGAPAATFTSWSNRRVADASCRCRRDSRPFSVP